MSQECQICCLDFNKPVLINCLGCKSKICKDCHQRYICESTQLAHCMSCKSKWTNKFLYENFTKTWVNKTYRDHIKSVVLDREKSKITQTLAILPRERARVERRDNLKELKTRKSELLDQLHEIRSQIRRLEGRVYGNNDDSDNETDEAEKILNFICPCPIEDCRGMIESRSFKCGVCDQKVCRRCRSARKDGDEHLCTKEDLETMKLIRKDTKPCPQCAVPIYKLSGCLQMFCTQCHIVFNWKTGQQESGAVHNPHALQWQREHGGLMRDINDIPCGGLINFLDLNPYLTWSQNKLIRDIYYICQNIEYTLNSCGESDFEAMRLHYVLNKITEKQWKQRIFNTERSNARKQSVREILTTFRTLLVERFRNLLEICEAAFVEENPNVVLHEFNHYGNPIIPGEETRSTPKSQEAYEKFIKDVEVIRKFTNDALMTELPVLGTTHPNQITEEWNWKIGYMFVVR